MGVKEAGEGSHITILQFFCVEFGREMVKTEMFSLCKP